MDSLTNWFQKTVIQTIWYEYYWSHHAYVTRKAPQRSKAKFFNRPFARQRKQEWETKLLPCWSTSGGAANLWCTHKSTTRRIKTTFFSAPVYFLYCIPYAEEKTSKVGYLCQMTRYTYGYIVYLCSWSDWFIEEKTTKRVGHSRVYCDHTRWHVVHIFPRRLYASNAARKPMGSNNEQSHSPLILY